MPLRPKITPFPNASRSAVSDKTRPDRAGSWPGAGRYQLRLDRAAPPARARGSRAGRAVTCPDDHGFPEILDGRSRPLHRSSMAALLASATIESTRPP